MSKRISVPALRVHQWLHAWDKIRWKADEHRAKPQQWFYQFSIAASDLKALSGVFVRTTKDRQQGQQDLGIQRRHEPERSKEIGLFIQYGYPWSNLSKAKRASGEFADLQKPGWLPTAIVVNILKPGDERGGKRMANADAITIEDGAGSHSTINLPKAYSSSGWRSTSIPPIEVIDGQHRLWAFDESQIKGDYELPVVAFVGLDLSWQAYLFYTINIKPKKINASLAFDLYPLLRTEEWLTKFEGHVVYRETRAQELVDLLFKHSASPWRNRINMLGETGYRGRMVSQSAWIRSLLAAYVKRWEGKRVRIGGLFGAGVGTHEEVLPWSRAEQAAFLIVIGQHMRDAIAATNEKWAKALRSEKNDLLGADDDPAFFGENSLLNQDQGIRAFLHVTNDLCYVSADNLDLALWGGETDIDDNDEERVNAAIRSLRRAKKVASFIEDICNALATYDWRASGANGLDEEQALLKRAFRGSGGYKELRVHVLRHLEKSKHGAVASAAKTVIRALS